MNHVLYIYNTRTIFCEKKREVKVKIESTITVCAGNDDDDGGIPFLYLKF